MTGRYYKPLAAGEGEFTSGEIDLTAGTRVLPPASTVSPPGEPAVTVATIPSPPPQTELLGLSWTWFGEGEEILTDHADGQLLPAQVEVSLLAGEATYGPFAESGYSCLPIPAEISTPFRYRVRFAIPDAQFDTILLTTPVFDDITIFYRASGSEFEYFSME